MLTNRRTGYYSLLRNKKFVYYFIDRYKRNVLSKKNIYLEKGVLFNKKTIFENNIKIYTGTQILNSEIGKGTYIGCNSVFNDCLIGRFCSIAASSKIIYGTHPSTTYISSHPAFFSKNNQAGFSFTNENLFSLHVPQLVSLCFHAWPACFFLSNFVS